MKLDCGPLSDTCKTSTEWLRARGAHGFQLSMSHVDGHRSTFIVHDNMTVTLNKSGGTHQTASMAERYGHTQQPGHLLHHVHRLSGPHGPRTGPTPRALRATVRRSQTGRKRVNETRYTSLDSYEPSFGGACGALLCLFLKLVSGSCLCLLSALLCSCRDLLRSRGRRAAREAEAEKHA